MTAPSLATALRDFAAQVEIDSKETGQGPFVPYTSQLMLWDKIEDCLLHDVHDLTILKARQLGISTAQILVDMFWMLTIPGTQGALVADEADNKERFRQIITRYKESLPPEWTGATITVNNRSQLIASNGSTIDYMTAGRRAGKKGLGTSRAINLLHATECAKWGPGVDIDSLRAALAQKNRSRLYVWESTAEGYNWFYDHCQEAKADPRRAFLFIGAWAHPEYRLARGTREFKFYWNGKVSREEADLVHYVLKNYGIKITQEQIAWRRAQLSVMSPEGVAQEYPWTEEEAFVATGPSYFPSRYLLHIVEGLKSKPPVFRGLRYEFGDSFRDTELTLAKDVEEADLRIFQEPVPDGVYAIGVDPSFARSPDSDYHAVQVFRGYADRIEQVAEYRSRDVETYKIAWVLAHLAGCYRNSIVNLEITGPGGEVMNQLRALRAEADFAMPQGDGSLKDFLGAIRWYLYKRPDAMRGNYVYNWQTNADNKARMFAGFRDSILLNRIVIRSMRLATEMRQVVQLGHHIEAQGKDLHDDLTMAAGLAHEAWSAWQRKRLIAKGTSWSAAQASSPSTVQGQAQGMVRRFLGRIGTQGAIQR